MTETSAPAMSQQQEDDGGFDRVCEAISGCLCPIPDDPEMLKNTYHERDILDYTFEKVETFTCGNEDDTVAAEEDNLSIVSEGPPPGARTLEPNSTDQSTTEKNTSQNQDGDMLDYVFENVESLVCAEDIPDDKALQAAGAGAVSVARDHSLLEMEEEPAKVQQPKQETPTEEEDEESTYIVEFLEPEPEEKTKEKKKGLFKRLVSKKKKKTDQSSVWEPPQQIQHTVLLHLLYVPYTNTIHNTPLFM